MSQKTTVIFSDMVSENWEIRAELAIIPQVGETVDFPYEGAGKVSLVSHKYVSGEEGVELSHIEIVVIWNF